MIPQAELDRALARWKARKMGQETDPAIGDDGPDAVPRPVPVGGAYEDSLQIDSGVTEDPTRVASPFYEADLETPSAEVHPLGMSDYDDDQRR